MWTPAQIIPGERTANSQVSIPSWLRCFSEDTLGSSGLEKEKDDFQYTAFILNSPLEFMETHSCFNKPSISCSSSCFLPVSVEPFMHHVPKKTHLQKWTENPARVQSLAEPQLLHISVVIPGGCQNSHPETTKLKTHEPKLPKGVSTI